MGSRQTVLVSIVGISVLNAGIFWRKAKTKRLFSQCGLSGTPKAPNNSWGTSCIQVGPFQFVALQGHLKHTETHGEPRVSRLVLSRLWLFRDTWSTPKLRLVLLRLWLCLGCSSLRAWRTQEYMRLRNPLYIDGCSFKEPLKFWSKKHACRWYPKSITTGRRVSIISGSSFSEKHKHCKMECKTVNFEYFVMALWVSELFYFIAYLQVVVILVDEIWPVRNNICPAAAEMYEHY